MGRTFRQFGADAAAVIVVVLLSFVCSLSALSVSVVDKECVFEYVYYDSDTVRGNFVVDEHTYYWNSDSRVVDFTVTSPGGSVVYNLKGSTGEKFEFKAPTSGMHKFCFQNPHSSTPLSISFNIHAGHIPTEHDLAKDEHLEPVNVKIAELREALEAVILEQKFLKACDVRHRHTNESTRRRVIFYTVVEYVFLVLVGGLQVTYIRRLFNNSISYMRI